jgi:ATP-dependent helicase HrpB
MPTLPVELVLPDLVQAFQQYPSVILQAPPGAGKTSKVPLALLTTPVFADQTIIMLEPRRLAAVNAARWLAATLGEEPGSTVGYAIRHERRVGPATRLQIVTEGLLTRRLQDDPELSGVGMVIFDEFHERSLQADTGLAFCLDVQRSLRPDLKILVMSATLDPVPLSLLLGNARVIVSEGRQFPVEVRYLGEPAGDPVVAVARTVVRALRETIGDILVFLPGAGEIRRCQTVLEELLDSSDRPALCPLYGDLSFAEQERAICPGPQRRVVLATNIAETSLTIEGVRVVVDAGLSRRLHYDPATGLNRLVTERVTVAAATQRAGRAGRLGPGICYRLWSEHQQSTLLPFTPPEIRTAELSELYLQLAQWGVAEPASLAWLDPPPAPALAEARQLLASLGGIDANGRITRLGRQMARFPLHPRLARLLLGGIDNGVPATACDLAALLSERDIVRTAGRDATVLTDCDLLDRLATLRTWRSGEGSSHGQSIDPAACRTVDRAARQLRRLARVTGDDAAPAGDVVGLLAARAFPERIGRQREPGSDRYLLANGRGCRLGYRSGVRGAQYIVAVQVDAGEGAEGIVHVAARLELSLIRREFSADIRHYRESGWNEAQARVEAREVEALGVITIASRPVTATTEEAAAAVLEYLGRGDNLALLPWSNTACQLRARVEFLSRLQPDEGFPDYTMAGLRSSLGAWLEPWLAGVRGVAELARLDLATILASPLTWEQRQTLERAAPEQLQVPSGRTVKLDYAQGDVPVLAVKLQELFGLAATPTVANGRVPVLIHLLSPAGRPIQVTRDLRSFWDTVYPEVKKELKGRYPRHPWPDNPWQAEPTRGTNRRSRQ